jgi:cytochrome c peroxidase
MCFAGLAGAQNLPEPLTDDAFLQFDPAQARLGQLLFFDPLLSGNRNISCATCHSRAFGSGDGVALSFGEGGQGIGPDRRQGTAVVRQSRNAPALWNLGAKEVRVLFHDGRVERHDGGFRTPAGGRLPDGLNSILAAQILFPLLARTEMAGDPNENEIGSAAVDNPREAWARIAARVQKNETYLAMFETAFGVADVEIVHVVNALAAYIDADFRAQDTPFDRYLSGDKAAMSEDQVTGMTLFYGKAGCSRCHSGPLFSDQKFHSIGVPQFGPGLTRRFDPVARDVGRMAVTDNLVDAYLFRTPFLRNVARSSPYGHNGAFATLEDVIRHHANPIEQLQNWTSDRVTLLTARKSTDDFAIMSEEVEKGRLLKSVSIFPVGLSDIEIHALVAFLNSLNSSDAPIFPNKPPVVPSKLPFQ